RRCRTRGRPSSRTLQEREARNSDRSRGEREPWRRPLADLPESALPRRARYKWISPRHSLAEPWALPSVGDWQIGPLQVGMPRASCSQASSPQRLEAHSSSSKQRSPSAFRGMQRFSRSLQYAPGTHLTSVHGSPMPPRRTQVHRSDTSSQQSPRSQNVSPRHSSPSPGARTQAPPTKASPSSRKHLPYSDKL